MFSFSKDFITVDYKSDKWESLITLAKKEQSDALILALANSKNIPEEYISQLYDMTNYSQATLLLSSDYTPHHIISEILDVMMELLVPAVLIVIKDAVRIMAGV